MKRLIGIAGRMGTGKTTCAQYLEIKHGFTRDAYASSLKLAASAAFGIPISTFYRSQEERLEVDPYWGMSYREMLQYTGTEAFRGTFGSEFWVMSLWKRHADLTEYDKGLVIEDVRFPEEAQAIIDRGGFVIEVLRPREVEPPELTFWEKLFGKKEHASETPIPDEYIAYRVMNDATHDQLHWVLDKILEEIDEK